MVIPHNLPAAADFTRGGEVEYSIESTLRQGSMNYGTSHPPSIQVHMGWTLDRRHDTQEQRLVMIGFW